MAKMLTLAEAGDRLGLSAATLRSQVRHGRLRATLIGKTYVVTERELERYRAESLGTRRPRCCACGTRPAVVSTGPTWHLCADCMAASDAWDAEHGTEAAARIEL